MPVKLHYGPPGSYKTSGAVLDDLPIALKEGRVLITNIRGLDDPDKVKATYGQQKRFKLFRKYKVSDDFDIIFIDTKTEEGRVKLRYFFHWAPQDAYFIIDEINTIYPKKWTEKTLEKFNLHTGSTEDLINPVNHLVTRHGEIALGVDGEPILRPQNVVEALEMHRHFNWDFSCTSPSYKKFNALFHDVAEVAFKHVNRGVIGVSGSYWEQMHLATNSGTSKADILQDQVRSIPQFIFDLYGSTATGQVRDTSAGNNVFLQPKVFFVLFLIIGLFAYGSYEINRVGLFAKNVTEEIEDEENNGSNALPTKKGFTSNNYNNGSGFIKTRSSVDPSDVFNNDFLQDYEIYLAGILMGTKLITLKKDDKQRQTNIKLLIELGYSFNYLDRCSAIISHPEFRKRFVTCQLKDQSTDFSLLPNGESIKSVSAVKKDAPLIKNPFRSPDQ